MPTRLTEDVVRNANIPASGSTTIWDDPQAPARNDKGVTGFGLRVHASGTKSFFLNYRADGTERRHTIGKWPEWTVTAARGAARDLRQRGGDPAQERRARREAPTVRDLAQRYIADHLPTKTCTEQQKADERRMMAVMVDRLGANTLVTDVHHGDIQAVHRYVTETRGPVRANRILAAMSKAFSLALRPLAGENKPWRDAALGNPCKGVTRNPEEGRERFYSLAELAAIADALGSYGRDARGAGIASAKAAAECVRLIMLTGCRPKEAMHAQWSQFDSEPGFWIKPAASFKSRRAHKVPLNPPALEVINRSRKARPEGAAWVFPGQRPGEPLQQLRSVWEFVKATAGLKASDRLYDLRHSFASVGLGHGFSLQLIGRLLGHTQARTTQRYTHLSDDWVRDATNTIGATMAPPVSPTDNVAEFPKKPRQIGA